MSIENSLRGKGVNILLNAFLGEIGVRELVPAPSLAAYPQLKRLRLLVGLPLIDPMPRPRTESW
jgi:hypothetical protein